jgi:hypothetical protein
MPPMWALPIPRHEMKIIMNINPLRSSLRGWAFFYICSLIKSWRNIMCWVKLHDRGILKIKGLGRGDSGVQPLILGIYPTHGLYL